MTPNDHDFILDVTRNRGHHVPNWSDFGVDWHANQSVKYEENDLCYHDSSGGR